MIITPDLHVTITLTADIIQYICQTLGFIALCWAGAKIVGHLVNKNG